MRLSALPAFVAAVLALGITTSALAVDADLGLALFTRDADIDYDAALYARGIFDEAPLEARNKFKAATNAVIAAKRIAGAGGVGWVANDIYKNERGGGRGESSSYSKKVVKGGHVETDNNEPQRHGDNSAKKGKGASARALTRRYVSLSLLRLGLELILLSL